MYEYKAYVKSVYDGDTITVDFDLGFGVTLKDQKLRLYGINTPEIRGVSEEEKVKGKESRNVLRDLILEKNVLIQTIKNKWDKDRKGKYGRWLAIVKIEDLSVDVNTFLVENNYAERKDYG